MARELLMTQGNGNFRCLPIFAIGRTFAAMSTMNISLPESLKAFVDQQVQAGYSTSSEYVRELIRRDQQRCHLRGLLLEGAQSPPAGRVDDVWFRSLRDRVTPGSAGPE